MTPDSTHQLPPDFTVTADPLATAPDPNATGAVGSAPTAPLPADATLEELGRGAMGVVYKATQPGLNRTVAVKMLLGEAADPRMALRFLAEAEAVAAIDHSHVVRVFEFGRRDGKPFLTMEYLPGGTLADRLAKRGRQPADEAARLVHKLALGVAAAHAAGIVHRDLKPANVLFDAAGEPKVTDFGLAKRTVGADLTRTQAVMGTPAYMSPEQAKGESKFVGPPADVWALGVILYECLTGKRPFTGEDTWALLQQVMSAEPASVRSLSGGVSQDVELIVAKCLRKDPAERYATAAELAEDLARYLAGEPVTARAVGWAERGYKWARRKPTAAAAWATGLVALGCGLAAVAAGTLWQRSEADRVAAVAAKQEADTRRAELAEANASLDEERTKAVARGEQLAVARVEADQARDREEAANYASSVHLAVASIDAHQTKQSQDLLDACPPARRGWEWDYAHRLCHQDSLTIGRPGWIVTAAALSPDGTQVLTAETSAVRTHLPSAARLYNVSTGGMIREFHRDEAMVCCVAFNAAGTRIAVGDDSGRVEVWEAAGGLVTAFVVPERSNGIRPIPAFPSRAKIAHRDEGVRLYGLAFSPDGDRLATSSAVDLLLVWDVRTGKQVARAVTPKRLGVKETDTLGWTAAFSRDGRRLITSRLRTRPNSTQYPDSVIEVWDAANGQRLAEVAARNKTSTPDVAFSPAGTHVLGGDSDPDGPIIRIWDTATGKPTVSVRGLGDGFVAAAFLPDGKTFLTSRPDGVVELWEGTSGRRVSAFQSGVHEPSRLTLSPDGHLVVISGDRDLVPEVWSLAEGRLVARLVGHNDSLITVQFAADSRTVLTLAMDDTTRVWHLDRFRPPVLKPVIKFGSEFITFDPNGRRFLVYSYLTGTLEVRDATGERPPMRLPWIVPRLDDRPEFDRTGSRVVVQSPVKVGVFDTHTGEKVAEWAKAWTGPAQARLDPAGRRLVVWGSEWPAPKVFAVDDGRLLRTLASRQKKIVRLGIWFRDDGRTAVLTFTHLGVETTEVWDTTRWMRLSTIPDVDGGTERAAAAPAGGVIATTSFDGIWTHDIDSGSVLATMKGHTGDVVSLAFSPDGRRLVSASLDATVRVWDVASGRQLASLRTTPDTPQSARFSDDGRQILVNCGSRFRVYDATPINLAFRREPAPLPRPGG